MTILEGLKKVIVERSYSLSDVWHYFLGNYRYYFWYGGKLSKRYAFIAWLRKKAIRNHIKEQIEWRIKWMDQDCFNSGSCKLCGCETTALQMCNKSCKKPCYPPMMTRKQWNNFWHSPFAREFGYLDTKNGRIWKVEEGGKPIVVKEVTIQDLRDYVSNHVNYVSKDTSRPGNS